MLPRLCTLYTRIGHEVVELDALVAAISPMAASLFGRQQTLALQVSASAPLSLLHLRPLLFVPFHFVFPHTPASLLLCGSCSLIVSPATARYSLGTASNSYCCVTACRPHQHSHRFVRLLLVVSYGSLPAPPCCVFTGSSLQRSSEVNLGKVSVVPSVSRSTTDVFAVALVKHPKGGLLPEAWDDDDDGDSIVM
jgi:hypothetical protein